MSNLDELVLSHFWWDDFKNVRWMSKSESEERLCALFLYAQYSLVWVPPLGKSNYPWLEWPPVQDETWRTFWYQSKFWEKPFSVDLVGSCENIKDKVDKLVIFTKANKPAPSGKLVSVGDLDLKKPKANKEWWDTYFESLKKRKGITEIELICGEEFLSKLKNRSHSQLVYLFFSTDEIKQELLKKLFEEVSESDYRVTDTEKKVSTGFSWPPEFFEDDLRLAKHFQKIYTMRKLGYATLPCVMSDYDELERATLDVLYTLALMKQFPSLRDFLASAVIELEYSNTISQNFKLELESMISDKRWIFVNHGTEGNSILSYEAPGKIIFSNLA